MASRTTLPPETNVTTQHPEQTEQHTQQAASSLAQAPRASHGTAHVRPQSYGAAGLVALQRTVGNRAVQRLLRAQRQQPQHTTGLTEQPPASAPTSIQVQARTATQNTTLQRAPEQQALQQSGAPQHRVATPLDGKHSAVGGAMVQRLSVQYAKQDTQLDAYMTALDTLVGQAAAWALNIDNVPDGAGGYYDRWKNLAIAYLGDPFHVVDPFLCAAYGYAVETRTNELLDGLAGNLPANWTVNKQVTVGMTRPDIVISDATPTAVAWIDLTSNASVGHIKKKAGGGWSTKPYVFEVTYPPLDATLINQNGPPSQAAKLRAAVNANKKAREDAEGTLGVALIWLQTNNHLSQASTPADAKAAFEARFPDEHFTHNTIRSIIEMGREDIRDFGYAARNARNGRNKAGAESFLARQFL